MPSNDKEICKREVRVALVLYGGVSLAIYENGVARSFFDLVKKRSVFGFLLELLCADAVVDVISGTSAGGINGIMLAAALESGSDFGEVTPTLWREHGDFEKLLRGIDTAENAESILDGEGYYQEKLVEAFRALTNPENPLPKEEQEQEIDLFITGTDLHGHVRTYKDYQHNKIEDKSHRTIFRLEHRARRKFLGVPPDGLGGLKDGQAYILASLARLTSTFPAAFPPFRIEQLPQKYRDLVRKAFEVTTGLKWVNDDQTRNGSDVTSHHIYLDGGVLDNKPFGPLIRAIFYRMPKGPVDRRLFYIEPEPEQFTRIRLEPTESGFTPLGIAVASLVTLPRHESIAEDLDALIEHNERLRWFNEFHEKLQNETGGQRSNSFYWDTRIDHLAKSLVISQENPPSARDVVPAVYFEDYEKLKKEEFKNLTDELNKYDIDFHLRQTFFYLYEFYKLMEISENNPDLQKQYCVAIQALGRVIKALKLIRIELLRKREGTRDYKVFKMFLSEEAPAWGPIFNQQLLNRKWSFDEIKSLADAEKGILNRKVLGEICKDFQDPTTTKKAERESATTILEHIEAAVKGIAEFFKRKFDFLERIDKSFYPLQYASGIFELDTIEYVRISPKDAQDALSRLQASSKVTGDELAHFSAFLRKDWRTNDILWGRLDSICMIINSLLDNETLARLKLNDYDRAFSEEKIRENLKNCPQSLLTQLFAALQSLYPEIQKIQELRQSYLERSKETIKSINEENMKKEVIEKEKSKEEQAKKDLMGTIDASKEKFNCFRQILIRIGQEEAVQDDLKTLYADRTWQEEYWKTDRITTPPPVELCVDPAFTDKSILNWPAFLLRLQTANDPLYEKISKNSNLAYFIQNYKQGQNVNNATKDQIVAFLNGESILQSNDLHLKLRKGVVLPQQLQDILDKDVQDRSLREVECLNRFSLESWYRGLFAPARPTRGNEFRNMEIGNQTVVGPKSGRIPANILGEYASQTYLLVWGMLVQSLGKNTLLKKFKLRFFLRQPVLFIYFLLNWMRNEKIGAALLLVATGTVLITTAVIGIYLDSTAMYLLSIAGFLLLAWVVSALSPKYFRRKPLWRFSIVLLVSILTAAIAIVLPKIVSEKWFTKTAQVVLYLFGSLKDPNALISVLDLRGQGLIVLWAVILAVVMSLRPKPSFAELGYPDSEMEFFRFLSSQEPASKSQLLEKGTRLVWTYSFLAFIQLIIFLLFGILLLSYKFFLGILAIIVGIFAMAVEAREILRIHRIIRRLSR